MSSILVVEPRKILQHATAIALFPEHEARMTVTIPDAGELQKFAAVIVDAAALRETNALSAQTLRAMETWKAPIIWVDGDPPQPPKRDKLVIVKRPISRKAIRAALAQCLGQALDPEAGRAGNPTGENAAAAAAKGRNVIELVDVVEPVTAGKQSKGERKKK
jgi:hypothetical protein